MTTNILPRPAAHEYEVDSRSDALLATIFPSLTAAQRAFLAAGYADADWLPELRDAP